MTGRELVQILYDNVTFPPATANKRFVRDMAARPADYVLSERAERYAWRIAYHFRRQLPKTVADEAVARKVDHKLISAFCLQCSVCGLVLLDKRQRNSPCPGPPEPKPIKTQQRKECSGTRGAVAVAESPSVAPQESLWEEWA